MVNLDKVQIRINHLAQSTSNVVVDDFQAALDELVWFRENFNIMKEADAAEAHELILETVWTMIENEPSET